MEEDEVIIMQLTPTEASELEYVLREAAKNVNAKREILEMLENITNALEDWENN